MVGPVFRHGPFHGFIPGIGRQGDWHTVFLAERTPLNRVCLGFSKVLFIITLCTSLMMVLDGL
jgi:hypothetical protein